MAIRIGILGAAKIAPSAIILPAQASDQFEVVAVGARDKSRAEHFAKKHDIPHVADGYAELVEHADVDVVYNALPPNQHKRWTIAALKAGKPVLCEKPFAMNSAEARDMVSTAQAAELQLVEAFHYRFHRVMRRAIEIVRSGELGMLVEGEVTFAATIPYRPGELRWMSELGGGAMMDLGCYCVHALRALSGEEPKIVNAECDIARGVDEVTRANLAFPSGLRVSLCVAMNVPSGAMLRLKGKKGSLAISNFAAPQTGCRFTVETGGKIREEPVCGPATYDEQLAHLGDVLLRGADPITSGEDVIANMAAIDAIYDAAGYVRKA